MTAELLEFAFASLSCLTMRRSVRKISAANSIGIKLKALNKPVPPTESRLFL